MVIVTLVPLPSCDSSINAPPHANQPFAHAENPKTGASASSVQDRGVEAPSIILYGDPEALFIPLQGYIDALGLGVLGNVDQQFDLGGSVFPRFGG